jgi:UDP-2,3-diacylglucosamine pyrophosphatase LpxH
MDTLSWPRYYRSVWISDTHLGTRTCQAKALSAFLDSLRCEQLYLVGDIVDLWQLKKNWYWDADHDACVQAVLRMARNGTQVIYVPGNHDEFARGYCNAGIFRIVELAESAVHETADGRRLLVIHGDQFDGVVKYARWLAFLGDTSYQAALTINRWFNLFRRVFGYPYWSLSAYLKHMVKNAVAFISDFEHALAAEAKRRGTDGVICGHIHHAEIKEIGGVIYGNCGDWVESLTALVEHPDGTLAVVRSPALQRVTQLALAS